ncbi:MAG: VanZ family protein [Bacteroidetes bacterium]|nr:VanZ family protein [Bacteroidota bacterium]
MKPYGLKKFIPGIAWFFIICFLVFLPGKDVPSLGWMDQLQIDKLVHAFMFFMLILFFYAPFYKIGSTANSRKKSLILLCIAGVIWGISIEFIQKYFVPGRSFDLFDWLADSIGVALAFLFCRRYIK